MEEEVKMPVEGAVSETVVEENVMIADEEPTTETGEVVAPEASTEVSA